LVAVQARRERYACSHFMPSKSTVDERIEDIRDEQDEGKCEARDCETELRGEHVDPIEPQEIGSLERRETDRERTDMPAAIGVACMEERRQCV
jgi:hypothetical protein